mmetsp:Transcript_1586/g.2260  ORF Transcript_1586/g.2260 Transcript_1586/m.2260 type:complete len:368 (-) Transcript_1586:87-1190(-)
MNRNKPNFAITSYLDLDRIFLVILILFSSHYSVIINASASFIFHQNKYPSIVKQNPYQRKNYILQQQHQQKQQQQQQQQKYIHNLCLFSHPNTPSNHNDSNTPTTFDDDKKEQWDDNPSILLPDTIQSTVLKQVYPAMMDHIQQYGNPNIPLGNVNGKMCKTLRRLAFQGKLTEDEIKILRDINFRFNSFEDIYEEADFEDCLTRLLKYEEENKTNYQIPKKYNLDPELGAWVTMIRRIGKEHIDPDRREKLDEIGFAWISTRKCGSAFMKSYRELKERLEGCFDLVVVQEVQGNDDTDDADDDADNKMLSSKWKLKDEDRLNHILKDQEVQKWVNAQRMAAEKGNLSDSRCEYLDNLPGLNWRQPM